MIFEKMFEISDILENNVEKFWLKNFEKVLE